VSAKLLTFLQENEMPSLIEAFKSMKRQGLIAKCECFYEHCGEERIQKSAQRWHEKQREIRGFVHVGEWNPRSTLDELRIPLLFGTVTDDTVAHDDHDCLEVGEVIAECLEEEGIRYDWDRVPGSPILVKADELLSGIPLTDHQHVVAVDEEHRVFRSPPLPESALDVIAGNPVRLLNLATLRKLNVQPPHLVGSPGRPRAGDKVKLGFILKDAIAPKAEEELGELVHRIQLESMWVEVMKVRGIYPQNTFIGELLNKPEFIDPAKLRMGSPVNFTMDNVYPIEKHTRNQSRR
jgi:hypothetical protein